MADLHKNVPEPEEAELARVRERMAAFCFPNAPRTAAEREALERAVRLQYEHEATAEEAMGGAPPQGVQAFRIGEFQMSVDGAALEGRLTLRTICPAAYGLLLRSGLLYRGAEGR